MDSTWRRRYDADALEDIYVKSQKSHTQHQSEVHTYIRGMMLHF
jgi:hypothetical protein